MRGALLSIVIGLLGIAAMAARAETNDLPDPPICNSSLHEWERIGTGADVAGMTNLLERTPNACRQLRSEISARIGVLTASAHQPSPIQSHGSEGTRESHVTQAPVSDPCAEANAAWRYLRDSSDKAALQNFIDDTDPNCAARSHAEERLAALSPPPSQTPPSPATGSANGNVGQVDNTQRPRQTGGSDLGRIAGALLEQYARQRTQQQGGSGGSNPASGPDFHLNPNYTTLALHTGFTPDPRVIELQSGGTVNAAVLGAHNPTGNCVGMIAGAPDVRLNYTAGNRYPLIISVASQWDTTLVVNGPDGKWYCNDDGPNGRNPSLRFERPASGQYDIWVGTYGGQELHPAQLNISEVTSR